MKPISAIFFVLIFSLLYSSDFENKADAAAAALASARSELETVKALFEKETLKIEKLKGKTDFFAQAALKRSLSKANRLAYSVNFLHAEIDSITNDAVTYSFMLVDAYSRELKDCMKTGCSELEKIKEAREKYLSIILEYGTLAVEEESDQALLDLKQNEAVLDVRDELEKKMIRLEQRIFILEEEKAVMRGIKEIEKAAGIETLINKMEKAMKRLKADLENLGSAKK